MKLKKIKFNNIGSHTVNTGVLHHGFTLIELMVVIAVIGLLASVIIVALANARGKSRNAKRMADIKQIATSMEVYFNDCGSYPIILSTAAVILDGTRSLSEGTGTNCGNNNRATAADGGIATTSSGKVLFNQFPVAPTPQDLTGTCDNANTTGQPSNTATITWPTGATWNDYVYYGTSTAYQVTFCLGQALGGLSTGKHILNQSGAF